MTEVERLTDIINTQPLTQEILDNLTSSKTELDIVVQEIVNDPTSVQLNEDVLKESVQELQQVRLIVYLTVEREVTVGYVSGDSLVETWLRIGMV